ncbi:MAG: protease SohB [Woeseiaceae bacterium]|nr:protease SohB [Woeseiaceae bacterium]
MAEFLADYGLFLLKAITIVAAIVVVIGTAAAANKRQGADELVIENLNKKYRHLADMLNRAVLGKAELKTAHKERKKQEKEAEGREGKPRSFVLDFKGDLKASGVDALRQEITALLEIANENDEVIVRLDNHGGVVHEHGLAASQLVRIRDRGIPLKVCVDKVAASGGYLMACVADRIYAAPFAILGSIGVLAQIPNFNRLLDSHGVDFEQITAGEYKRTVTMFGKNTDEDRAKLREELEDVHLLFKDAVSTYRSDLDLDKVATGEHWYGTRALELGLADEIKTSDELLSSIAADRDIYQVTFKIKQPLQKRLMHSVDGALERLASSRWREQFESRLPR